MKKIIFALLTVAIVSNSVSAQKISADKVPVAVTAAFKAKFPTVLKTSWEMENKTEFEANFHLNGVETSANFDKAGKWLETEIEIKVAALPNTIQSAITKDYAGFKINEASKIESIKNGKCFEAEIEKGEETFDVLFSAEGKVLNKTKVEEKEKKD